MAILYCAVFHKDTILAECSAQRSNFADTAHTLRKRLPDYATKSAKLYDMTKPSFNWDKSTWKENYLTEFEDMKRSLAESVDRYFPD